MKNACCTTEYLVGVLNKKYYVPMYPDLQVRPCIFTPTKDELFKMLINEGHLAAFDFGFDSKHQPDKEWMLTVIATLNPMHAIFAKDYRPSRNVITNKTISNCLIKNPKGFFEGLP